MNKHCCVEVTGLVYVGNKLLQHDTGVTMWAVVYHNYQCLLDYLFNFLFWVSLILSGYISSYILLWKVWLGYRQWQMKRSVLFKHLVLSGRLHRFRRLVWQKMNFLRSILEKDLGGILLNIYWAGIFCYFYIFFIFPIKLTSLIKHPVQTSTQAKSFVLK